MVVIGSTAKGILRQRSGSNKSLAEAPKPKDPQQVEQHKKLIAAYQAALQDPNVDSSVLTETLVGQFIGLLINIAGHFESVVKDNKHLDSGDLISAGKLGLLKALKNYDLGEGTAPSTYISECILSSIQAELDKNINPMFRKQFLRIMRIYNLKLKVQENLELHQEPVTNFDIAKALKIDIAELDKLDSLFHRARVKPGSLEVKQGKLNSNDSLADEVSYDDTGSEKFEVTRERKDFLRVLIDDLTTKIQIREQDLLLLQMRFGLSDKYSHSMTYKEIASEIGISAKRVGQRLKPILGIMQEVVKPASYSVERDLGLGYGSRDLVHFLQKIYLDYLSKNEAWQQTSLALGGFLVEDQLSYEDFTEIFLKALVRLEHNGRSILTINQANQLTKNLTVSDLSRVPVPASLKSWLEDHSLIESKELASRSEFLSLASGTSLYDLIILFRTMHQDFLAQNQSWKSFAEKLSNWSDPGSKDFASFVDKLIPNIRDFVSDKHFQNLYALKNDIAVEEPKPHRICMESIKILLLKLSGLYFLPAKQSPSRSLDLNLDSMNKLMQGLYSSYTNHDSTWNNISDLMGKFLYKGRLAFKDFAALLLKRFSEIKVRLRNQAALILSKDRLKSMQALILASPKAVIKLDEAAELTAVKDRFQVVDKLRRGLKRIYQVYNKIRSGEILGPAGLTERQKALRQKPQRRQSANLLPNLAALEREFKLFLSPKS